MALTIRRVSDDAAIEDLGLLFGTDDVASRCWCMWFITSVKDFHASGAAGNRARFTELALRSNLPVGLLAYERGEPVGWCAVGPRSRYARGIKTPTYKGRDPAHDDDVWLVPCFYVRQDARGAGVTGALLAAAVDLAREHGAVAIEGFPYQGEKRQSRDTQVGFAATFAGLGFEVIREPSSSRVIMRLELAG